MEEKTVPGIILASRFVGKESKLFSGYINYIDRDEAVRNAAFHQYSAFVDGYMDNPAKQREAPGFNVSSDKVSALFTADRDTLSQEEKKGLKKAFSTAQKNGSYLWQNVISFDNGWLAGQGIYDKQTGWLDEARIRTMTRASMDVMLREEGMERSAVWSASVHYNTDNIHVHIAVAEPNPTREKMMYQGEEVYRSKLKPKTLEKMKSKALNTIVDRDAVLRKINTLIRENMVHVAKAHSFWEDAALRKQYLSLYRQLPQDRRLWNYGRNNLKLQPELDAFVKEYLQRYHPEELGALKEQLDQYGAILERDYGTGTKEHRYTDYAENKMHDLYKRMGNTVLQSLREYEQKLKSQSLKEPLEQIGDAYELDPGPPDIDMEEPQALDDGPAVEDDPPPTDEPVEAAGTDSWKWWSKEYKQARRALYGTKEKAPDFGKAYALMAEEAETGNGFAMHDVGKILLKGIGRDKEETAAQEWFKRAHTAFLSAEQTDYLQYRIGKLYSFGYGVEQDYVQAAAWYEKAAAANNPYARYSLGSLYHRGQGVERDETRAFELFQRAAEHVKKPNIYAIYELGRMYKNGCGTTPDNTLSEQWYASAYQGFVKMEKTMNDDKLQYRLGQMSLNGIGTEQNLQTAFSYFTKAVALKNADAEYGLGKLYLNNDFEQYNPRKAVAHLATAAKAGHDAALYTLGKMFLQGKEVEKDVPRALGYLEHAVEKENQFARYLLGKLLLQGEEVAPDLVRAEQLLSASAAQGNPFAAYTLGKAYLDGDVFKQDISQALGLLTAAAEQGNEFAAYTLGKEFLEGKKAEKDVPRALGYLEQAVEKENQFARYLLGKLLLRGEDVEPDPVRAEQLLLSSAAQGNSFAAYTLGKAYLDGDDLPQNLPQAILWYEKAAAQNNTPSLIALGRLYDNGQGVEQNFALAEQYYLRAFEINDQYRGNASYALGCLYMHKGFSGYDLKKSLYYLREADNTGHTSAAWRLKHFKQLTNPKQRLRNYSILNGSLHRLAQELQNSVRRQHARNQKEYQDLIRKLSKEKTREGQRPKRWEQEAEVE